MGQERIASRDSCTAHSLVFVFGIGILILVGIGAGIWWHQRRTGASMGGKPAPLGTAPPPVVRAPLARERSLTPSTGTATDWLGHSVQYFRAMGFFGQYVEWPDMVLATHLEQLYRQTWKRNFDPEDPLADFHLLKADVKRVWWEETAGRVKPSVEAYAESLPLWGAIARRVFIPRAITEDWETPRGPIVVSFVLEDAPHFVKAKVNGARLDVDILTDLNLLIEHSGIRFECVRPDDASAFIVALTHEEKSLLHHERGWQFSW